MLNGFRLSELRQLNDPLSSFAEKYLAQSQSFDQALPRLSANVHRLLVVGE